MEIAKIPANEKERLESLLSFNILDTDFENEYNELVSLASSICNTPIALISLVDSHRQWFKAKIGLDVQETSRDIAFCSHSLEIDDILIINDTFKDFRFADNPLVTGDPNIRFYAGAQLRTRDGNVLGTLCAIDRKPRILDANQIHALKILSKQVVARFELRKSYSELQKHANILNLQNQHKDKLFKVISHDLRSPFNSILGYTEILKEDIAELKKDEILEITKTIGETAKNTYELVNNLLNWSLAKSGTTENKKVLINLSKLIYKVNSVLAGLYTKKKIAIELNIENGVSIFGEYNILFSALQNILTNAIKFTPSDGKIRITTAQENDNALLIIEDSGVGLDKSEINNLLKSNVQKSRNGTDGEKGKGLGFNMAKDFIELSGGILELFSEQNKGTQVKITFPNQTN